ncbi:hypothetical protein TIFTF001_029153 [Ficus carica]|uniref:Uncharacterized protein n=1 Tax=Ficus carica TaxID=3494 RepID=A0AA88J2H2_FICCA|nr:hypothetical protein TIFTF001_029153 [Ficus carica]
MAACHVVLAERKLTTYVYAVARSIGLSCTFELHPATSCHVSPWDMLVYFLATHSAFATWPHTPELATIDQATPAALEKKKEKGEAGCV